MALFAILVVDVFTTLRIPVLHRFEGETADLALVFMVVYLFLEILNFSDRRRFVDYRYSFDGTGIYREKSLIIDWMDVSRVKVSLETFVDKIPAHRDVAWAPRLQIMRDYSTPELTTRKKVSRIIVTPVNPKVLHKLVIVSTPFSPAIRTTYRKMRKSCLSRNSSSSFSFAREYIDDTAEQYGS